MPSNNEDDPVGRVWGSSSSRSKRKKVNRNRAGRHNQLVKDYFTEESAYTPEHISLGRLQDSNAVLSHFNEYSEHCFAEVSGDFSRNTRLLKSMKTDLDYIFQKLRSMKSKLVAIYPDAFVDDSKEEFIDRRPDLELSQ
ncbi:hypothetical protein CDL15_Pgr011429 [Punica granatum]|uniref:KxDL domain-containing protein n=1 Tax=Punica granatum TaxID=22663 RepID=A0A218WGE4_PUNGR|nr:hypothetical protein CDL15_Pgr011429 [Punica granatum]